MASGVSVFRYRTVEECRELGICGEPQRDDLREGEARQVLIAAETRQAHLHLQPDDAVLQPQRKQPDQRDGSEDNALQATTSVNET